MNERIKKLRRALDLTQTEFAEKVGTSQNVIANYEIGRRNPSRSTVNNICKTFSVNEEWLRTGNGPMFIEKTRSEEIAALVDDILRDESDSFRRRFVAALSHLDLPAWEAIEAFTLSLAAQHGPAAPSPDVDIEREVAAYRAQLEAEKGAKGKLSASPGAKEA